MERAGLILRWLEGMLGRDLTRCTSCSPSPNHPSTLPASSGCASSVLLLCDHEAFLDVLDNVSISGPLASALHRQAAALPERDWLIAPPFLPPPPLPHREVKPYLLESFQPFERGI